MAHLDLSVALTNYRQFVTKYYVKWCIVQLCTLSLDDVIVSHMCLRRIPQGRQRELKSHIPRRRDRQGKEKQPGIAGMLKPQDKATNISFRFFRKTELHPSKTVSYLLREARLLLPSSSFSFPFSFSVLLRSFPNVIQKNDLEFKGDGGESVRSIKFLTTRNYPNFSFPIYFRISRFMRCSHVTSNSLRIIWSDERTNKWTGRVSFVQCSTMTQFLCYENQSVRNGCAKHISAYTWQWTIFRNFSANATRFHARGIFLHWQQRRGCNNTAARLLIINNNKIAARGPAKSSLLIKHRCK